MGLGLGLGLGLELGFGLGFRFGFRFGFGLPVAPAEEAMAPDLGSVAHRAQPLGHLVQG